LLTIKFKHFFYLSNLLSLLRLFLLIPIYLVLAWDNPSAKWVLLGLVFIAIASDYFDGLCARWMNQKTDLGRVLDPLADKILMVFGLIGFVIYIHFPLTLVLLLGYRDLMIFIGGVYLTKKSGVLKESNIWGKLNTLVVSFTGFFFIINPDWWWTTILLIASYAFVIYSGICYLTLALRELKLARKYWVMIIIIYLIPMAVIAYFSRQYFL